MATKTKSKPTKKPTIVLEPKSEFKTQPRWQTLLVFPVVGLGYYDYKPELVRRGSVVGLLHEPSNRYDRNAIKVMIAGRHIGYVARHLTSILHDAKAQGCKFFYMVNQHFPEASELHKKLFVKVKVLRPAKKSYSPYNYDGSL